MTRPTLSVKIGYSLGPFDTTATSDPAWVDEAAAGRVYELSYRHGRSNELDRADAGRGTIVLEDTDRRFDRFYASGAYAPLKRMRPIHVEATHDSITYNRFRAFIQHFPLEWTEGGDPKVSRLACPIVDGFHLLAGIEMPSAWEIEVATLAPDHWYRLTESVGAAVDQTGGDDGEYIETGLVTGMERASEGLVAHEDNGAVKFLGTSGYVKLPSAAHPTSYPVTIFGSFRLDAEDAAVNTMTIYRSSTLVVGIERLSVTPFFYAFTAPSNQSGATIDINDSAVHDFAVVMRANGTHAIYIDGVSCGSVITGTVAASALTAVESYVGRDPSVSSDISSFVGPIDELMIWSDRELTSVEVANLHNARVAPWSGDTAGGRIERVLDYAEWPVSWRSLNAGISTLLPASDIKGRSGLEVIQAAAEADGGLAFIDRGGILVFQDRHHRSLLIPDGHDFTLGDGGGSEIEYESMTANDSTENLFNRVELTRSSDNARFVTEDAASITDNGLQVFSRDLPVENEEDLRDAGTWLLLQRSDPPPRLEQVEVIPFTDAEWVAMLSREVSDYGRALRRPMSTGAAIDEDVFVESIEERIVSSPTHEEWSFTFDLSPASGYEFWILGHATYGVLGTTSRVGY